MRRKIISIVIAVLCWQHYAEAQTGLEYGVEAGMNFSEVGNVGSRTGFAAGVRGYLPLSDKESGTYLSAGLLFSQQGYTDSNAGEKGMKTTANYLKAPIHFGYRFSVSQPVEIFIDGGPYIAYGISGQTNTVALSEYSTHVLRDKAQPVMIFRDTESAFRDWNRLDIGLGVGIGCRIAKHWEAAASFDFGLTNSISKHKYLKYDIAGFPNPGFSLSAPPSVRNRCYRLSVGYIF